MLQSALEYNRAQERLAQAAGRAVASLPFERALRAIIALQLQSLRLVEGGMDAMLEEQGISDAPPGRLSPAGLVGQTGAGAPLAAYLTADAPKPARVLGAITVLQDTGRQGMSALMGAREVATYVRQTDGSACGRCVILAGRVYRHNQGFLRHPRCGCTHVPTTERLARTVSRSPEEIFAGMSRAEQDATFGERNAQAIRDGADMGQVVNVRSVHVAQDSIDGRSIRTTTSGTSRRGWYGGHTELGKAGVARPTPETLIRLAGDDRELAKGLLRDYGYILP